MRIAMLSYRLPVSGQKRGGIERVAHDLANGLSRRGHRVTVWSADPRPPDALYSVRPMPGRHFIEHPLLRRATMGYLGNFLALLPRFEGADVVIAHGDSMLLPLRGIPIIRVVHGSALEEARSARTLLRKILQYGVYLQELLTARTQTCVAVSVNSCEFNRAVRTVIPNGVDTALFNPGSTSKSPQPSIVFVGTLDGRKRGAQLLRWFSDHIHPHFQDATLWMVSERGPDRPGVTYFPAATDHELASLYRQAWVFASPSTYEGFGLPYLESMASGTPVLATSNPGSLEVLSEGQFGKLAASDSDFIAGLREILTDADLRERLTRAGLHHSSRFSLDRVSGLYEELARKLVSVGASQAS